MKTVEARCFYAMRQVAENFRGRKTLLEAENKRETDNLKYMYRGCSS